jgi:hypothetical protein
MKREGKLPFDPVNLNSFEAGNEKPRRGYRRLGSFNRFAARG